MLFAANDGMHGLDLWVTKGDAATTVLLNDLAPGALDGSPQSFLASGSNVYFAADDGFSGSELFKLPVAKLEVTTYEMYGAACAGSANKSPRIGLGGRAIPGTRFDVEVRDALGGQAAAVLASFRGVDILLPGGCRLLVDPALLFPAGIAVDASGQGRFPVALPKDARLLGARLHYQFAVLDPRGSFLGQFALSDALRVVVGY